MSALASMLVHLRVPCDDSRRSSSVFPTRRIDRGLEDCFLLLLRRSISYLGYSRLTSSRYIEFGLCEWNCFCKMEFCKLRTIFMLRSSLRTSSLSSTSSLARSRVGILLLGEAKAGARSECNALLAMMYVWCTSVIMGIVLTRQSAKLCEICRYCTVVHAGTVIQYCVAAKL
jgi:hypothetical protein